jgi:hypothetical protein
MTENEASQETFIAFLHQHLQSIYANDIEAYHSSTSPELTLYEWWVTPHRIDGLPFHEFMMHGNRRLGTVFGVENQFPQQVQPRFDLANLHVQLYPGTAIASYTLLTSSLTSEGVKVSAHNETRVAVQVDGQWQVVHVHKSPAWPAPYQPPK